MATLDGFMVWVEDVAAGADPAVAVTKKTWGQRVGDVRDLTGSLVEPAGPASW